MTDKKLKIGIFGGSFDPVHNGHVSLAKDAKNMAGLDEVIFVPAYIQPFKQDKKTADCNHRIEMLERAVLHEKGFSVSDYEIQCCGVSYTYKTLRHFSNQYGKNTEIYFICGTDSFLKIEKWKNSDEILTEYSYIVGTRPGYKTDELSEVIKRVRTRFSTKVERIDNKLVDVSSSEVRQCIDSSIHNLDKMIPGCVYEYIMENNLYNYHAQDYCSQDTDNCRMQMIDAYLKKHQKESRYRHTRGVVKLAVELSGRYGVNKEKAMLAAMLHDVCKGDEYPQDVMNNYIREFGLDEKYIDNTGLAHSKVASRIIPEKFGIKDKEILDAVDCHTTGKPAMSLLDKIIFLADAAEEGRDYPGVSEIRKLAFEDLDKAVFRVMDETIELVKNRGQFLDRDSIIARNYYKNQGDTDGY